MKMSTVLEMTCVGARRVSAVAARRATTVALMGVVMLAALSSGREAFALDQVTLRTNWLYYGSHAIFFLGIERGFYKAQGIDLTVKEGNGSANAVRLVANKDSTFAYASSNTMMHLGAQGAPVVSVAVIDAQSAEAVLARPDSGIKTIKDLEGKKVLTTAGSSLNTLFPVVVANAGLDPSKIQLVNVAEGALVSSYLQNLAPAMLGGIDDKPAEIRANGGEQPIIFPYTDYGAYQPGYSIVAHRDMVKDDPDLVRRFVAATLKSVAASRDDPDGAIEAMIKHEAALSDQRKQMREVLDVTLSILKSPNNESGRIGVHVAKDWANALELLKQYKELETDKTADYFYTEAFLPPA